MYDPLPAFHSQFDSTPYKSPVPVRLYSIHVSSPYTFQISIHAFTPPPMFPLLQDVYGQEWEEEVVGANSPLQETRHGSSYKSTTTSPVQYFINKNIKYIWDTDILMYTRLRYARCHPHVHHARYGRCHPHVDHARYGRCHPHG